MPPKALRSRPKGGRFQKGSEVPKKPKGFIYDIHEAAERGHSESVKFLIAKDKTLLEKKGGPYDMFYISE
jgi:hypothetical protein